MSSKVKEAAFVLFAENGYDATTMDQIATKVGIKKPTLYAYCRGKEDLFLSIYEELESDYREHMQNVIHETEGMGVEQKLRYILEKYITYFLKNPQVSSFWNRILFFPPPSIKDKLHSRALKNEERFQEKFKEIIKKGMEQGVIKQSNIENMVFSYNSIREGCLLFLTVLDVHSIQKKIDAVWNTFWSGIAEK